MFYLSISFNASQQTEVKSGIEGSYYLTVNIQFQPSETSQLTCRKLCWLKPGYFSTEITNDQQRVI